MFQRTNIFCLFYLFLSTGCTQTLSPTLHPENQSNWPSIQELYQSGQFEKARKVLEEDPIVSGNYHYNLGTIYHRIGQPGLSVAHLEKANRLSPHDADIQYNLSVARSSLSQEIGADNIDPASSWVEQISDRTSLNEVRATLGLLALINILLWLRAYLKTRRVKKAFLQPAGFLGLIGFAITLSIYGVHRWVNDFPPAICLKTQIVRSGPGDHYMKLSTLHEGSKFRLLGSTVIEQESEAPAESWQQIRYSKDGIGWIRSAYLLKI